MDDLVKNRTPILSMSMIIKKVRNKGLCLKITSTYLSVLLHKNINSIMELQYISKSNMLNKTQVDFLCSHFSFKNAITLSVTIHRKLDSYA